jgi:hypothetical protein
MNLQLEKNNFLFVPNFLTPQEAEDLAQNMLLADQAGMFAKDNQCPLSPAALNFLPYLRVLVKKIPEVSKICGEDVLPTYTYSRIYKNGEVLKNHKDRKACEISLTVTLQKDEVDWPFYIKKPTGETVSFNLNPGDALMYLGYGAEHWRESYQGNQQVQMFLHYVRAYGEFSNNAFNFFIDEPLVFMPFDVQRTQ